MLLSFLFVDKTFRSTIITNKLYSFTMQNFQVIIVYIWEPTDKIFHLHGCTINKKLTTRLGSAKKLESIFSDNRHFLKQTFQELTLSKVNQQPVFKNRIVFNCNLKISFLFHCHFLHNICDFWDQKHSRNFYNQICTHTKIYYSLYRYVPHESACVSFPDKQ